MTLKGLTLIDDIMGNTQMLTDPPRVLAVHRRAATPYLLCAARIP